MSDPTRIVDSDQSRLRTWTKHAGKMVRWGADQALRRFWPGGSDGESETDRRDFTEGMDTFIETMEGGDMGFGAHLEDSETSGTVLVVSLAPHPGYRLFQAVLGTHLSAIYQAKPVAIVDTPDPKVEALYRSIGFDDVIELGDLLDPGQVVRAIPKAIHLLSGIETKWDLRFLESDGMCLGRSIYNTYLKKVRRGTIERVDSELYGRVVASLAYRDSFRQLFEEEQVSCVALGESHYTPHAELGGVAINQDVPVFVPAGRISHKGVRQYRSGDSLSDTTFKPHEELFERMTDEQFARARKAGAAYMEERMAAKRGSDEVDVEMAYGSHKDRVTKTDVCEWYDWDDERPIAFILPHVQFDAPHGCPWSIFPDYTTWYRETLRIASDVDSVNWLVKPHPAEPRYDIEDTAENIYEGMDLEEDHLRLIDRPFNTASIRDIGHAVLTFRGTVGVELPCFGVPVIIAAESRYSGYGFTIEPQTPEEYEQALRRIDQLTPLSEEAISKAEAYAGLRFDFLGTKSSFTPLSPPTENFEFGEYWREAAKLASEIERTEDPFFRGLKRQVERGDPNLWDPKIEPPDLS